MNTFKLGGLVTIAVEGRGAAANYLRDEFAHCGTREDGPLDLLVTTGRFHPPAGPKMLLSNRAIAVGENWCLFTARHRGLKWRIMIKDPDGPTLRVHLRGGRLAARVFLLKTLIPLIRHRLQDKGATLVKASAVERDGKATVLAGWSGSGKTSGAVGLVDAGWSFLSDTFALLGADGSVQSMALLVHLFGRNVIPEVSAHLSSRRRLECGIKRMLHRFTLGRINLSLAVPFRELFGEGKIASSAKLSRFVLLTYVPQGETALRPIIDKAECVRRILCTERFEARDFECIRLAYVHANPESSLTRYWEQAEKILSEALESAAMEELTYGGRLGRAELSHLSKQRSSQNG